MIILYGKLHRNYNYWNQFFTWQIMCQWFMFYSISLQQDTVRDLPEALN